MKMFAPLVTLLSAGIIGSLFVGNQPAIADNRPLCEIADEWVVANIDHLPSTLDGVLAHPLVFQKAILRHSTNDVRVAIWREHLERFILDHPDLTEAQVEFIDGVALRLEEYFQAGPGSPVAAPLGPRARSVLGDDLAFAAIADLGARSIISEGLESAEGECECSVDSDWCMGINFDCSDREQCEWQSWGCGDLWLYACDGMCAFNPTQD